MSNKIHLNQREINTILRVREIFFAVNRYVNYAVVSNTDGQGKEKQFWLRITDER